MPKDEIVYVGHMLDKAQEALSLARGKTRQDYDHDTALRLALTHLIQVIGEAARRSILIAGHDRSFSLSLFSVSDPIVEISSVGYVENMVASVTLSMSGATITTITPVWRCHERQDSD